MPAIPRSSGRPASPASHSVPTRVPPPAGSQKSLLPAYLWEKAFPNYDSSAGVCYAFNRTSEKARILVQVPLPESHIPALRLQREDTDKGHLDPTRIGLAIERRAAVIVRGKVNHQMEVEVGGVHLAWFVVDHGFQFEPEEVRVGKVGGKWAVLMAFAKTER